MKKEKGATVSALRGKAEKRLDKRPKPSKISQRTIASLIHELQVHQIELEIQNENLRQAQTIIENSKKRFSDLYNFAPVGYITTEKTGKIIEANVTAAEILGVEKNDLAGKVINA